MEYDIIVGGGAGEGQLSGCLAALRQNAAAAGACSVTVAGGTAGAAHAAGFGAFACLPGQSARAAYKAQRRAARTGSAPWLVFLAPSSEVLPGFFEALQNAVQAKPQAAGFCFRQVPHDLEMHMDPVSLEVPFAELSGMAVRRDVFEAVGGLGKHLPCGAGADLGLRLRAAGHAIYYLPGAAVRRTNGAPGRAAYVGGVAARLLLAFKYGRCGEILAAKGEFFGALRHPQHFAGVRRALARQSLPLLCAWWPLFFWRFAHRGLFLAARNLLPESPAALPLRGAAPLAQLPENGPKISVVVRTHARPARLFCALKSLENQLYRNFEVVVVEDGAATAREMIEREFAHLPLRYYATGQPVGRSKAGNIGLEMAEGPWLNLLDDDDCFYPDHLALVAAQAQAAPGAALIITGAMALQTDDGAAPPNFLAPGRAVAMLPGRIDIFTMCQACQLASNSVAFKKSLFLQCGGLDEKLNAHEDWAMWLRFLAKAQRANPHGMDIPRATALFAVPASAAAAKARMQQYMAEDAAFFGDDTIRFDLSLADLRGFFDGVIADVEHVRRLGTLDDYLEKQAHRDAWRE